MKKLLILICLLFASTAEATTYYVNKSGSDGNSCATATSATDANAKLTVAAGAACLGAGDTLIIGDGTYNENLTNPLPSGSSSSAPTIMKCENQRLCILRGASGNQYGILLNSARNNIKFDGITIDMQDRVTGVGAAFAMNNSIAFTNLIITNSEFKNGRDDLVGLGSSVTGCTFSNNYLHDLDINTGPSNLLYVQASDCIIEHNTFKNAEAAITVRSTTGGAKRNIFRYNDFDHIAFDSPDSGSRVINVSADTSSDTDANVFYNNRFYDFNYIGITIASGYTKFYNNTMYDKGLGGNGIQVTGANVTLANNIVRVAGTAISDSGSGTIQTTNRTTGTVTDIWIDPATGNLSLKESSAAIDAGTVMAASGKWPGSTGLYVGAGVDQGALEAPIRSSAVVEDATDTIYRITFSMPLQSTRADGIGLQACTVGNIAITVAGAGATESSCSTSASASRVDVTLGAAVTVGQALTDAYTRSTAPTLTDNVCIGDPNTTCHNAHVRSYSATAGTNNVDGGALPALTQSRFRFHQLRGTEASPVLLAAENTNLTLPRGAAFRLRVKFRTDDDPASTAFKLRYSKDAGAYTDIPDAMGADYIAWYGTTGSSDTPAAGTATTELLTSDEASNTACAVVRSSSDYPLLDLNNSETECEYIIQISNSVAVGTTYDFRVYKSDNTALDTYTTTGRLTIGSYIAGW